MTPLTLTADEVRSPQPIRYLMEMEPIYVQAWNRQRVEVAIDADGDLRIVDSAGYSIIIHKDEMPQLANWLNKAVFLSVGEAGKA